MALTPGQDVSILCLLSKPLALAPERYEEFLEVAEGGDSPALTKSLQALRARFARAFSTPAATPRERVARLRRIADELKASAEHEEEIAGITLSRMLDQVAGRAS